MPPHAIHSHPTSIPLQKSEFQRAYRELLSAYAHSAANPGSYRSESCTRCARCMFCDTCEDCFNCTYCRECLHCSACTHCTGCEYCSASSYCIEAKYCSQCSYVLMSENCTECIFCFGCVGLVQKEFHILNKPFKKEVYFQLLETLLQQFRLKPSRASR